VAVVTASPLVDGTNN
jgi:hypothetical protein